ncbi:response regulator transcription factor [Nocardioides hankookensis]|uniref:Response regulator n=1 Tax=Nocardioides hankookensis TaxID=443157 RepID=A0ABW1LEK8_9ACTN
MTAPLRVLIADDNPIVRMGLVALLDNAPGLELCGEAADGREALALALERRPDVTLLDVRMPGADGLSVIGDLVPITRILMLTHSDEPDVISRALAAGATGYLLHGSFDPDELVRAVSDAADGQMRLSPAAAAVLAGGLREHEPIPMPADPDESATADPDRRWTELCLEHRLSPRELEVCRELVTGRSNRDIARQLFIEPKTVKNHINSVFAKLGVTSRAEALAVLLGTAEEASVQTSS